MDMSATFRALIRKVLGLPEDDGAPPDLVRLGLYRARVDACASDGSTLDVTPEDKRISPEKNVPVRVGIPGAVAVVQAGAIVLLGWERGDPGRPYCVPSWERGATLSSLSIGSSADAVATKQDLADLLSAISGTTIVAQDGGASFKSTLLAALSPPAYTPAWPRCSSTIKVQR